MSPKKPSRRAPKRPSKAGAARKATPARRTAATRTASPALREARIVKARKPARPAARRPPPEPPSSVPQLGRYVYCIVRASSPLAFGRIGLGRPPGDVTTVNFRDLAAVVSDTPLGVLDPTRENVLAHQRVNETVMERQTVLPMSFGTVFRTDDDIVEFLRSAHEAFADVINKMADKLEFGLKVLWDRDAVIRSIEAEDEGIRRLKRELSALKGSTYFARMQYGRMVDSALEARSESYVFDIFEALRSVAVASRSNKPIGDKMIMNAAFLVSRDEEPAFDAAVKQLGAQFDKLTFKYTGPWPPYNFVNIRLKLERA